MGLFSWLIGPKETEYERGKRNALAFFVNNPTQDEIDSYWSCACEDAAFSSDGYAKGSKEIIRQYRDREQR